MPIDIYRLNIRANATYRTPRRTWQFYFYRVKSYSQAWPEEVEEVEVNGELNVYFRLCLSHWTLHLEWT